MDNFGQLFAAFRLTLVGGSDISRNMGLSEDSKFPGGHIVKPKLTLSEKLRAVYAKLSNQERQGLIGLFGTLLVIMSGSIVQCSRVSGENSALKGQNFLLMHENQTNWHELQRLTAERDKFEVEAQNANNALAPWVQLANSQFTNTPVTKRLDKLFDEVAASVSASTNLLTSFNSQVPALSLTISNSNRLCWGSTDNTSMMTPFKDYFPLSLTVSNSSEFAVDRIWVDVETTVDATNTFAPAWQPEAPGTATMNFSELAPGATSQTSKATQFQSLLTHWFIVSRPLNGGGTFSFPTMYLTNVLKDSGGYSIVPVYIKFYATRSRTYQGSLMLVSPRKGGEVRMVNGVLDLN